MIEIALAFAAGLLTVAAPCILPLLPVLLGASIGQQDRRRPLFLVAGFVLTFSGFAILFGSFSTVLGLSHDTLRKISVILLGSFGVLLLWPQPYEWLMARLSGLLSFADSVVSRAGSGNASGLVVGLALGVLWTPCAGPVLGSIPPVTVDGSRLYSIYSGPGGEHVLRLKAPKAGLSAYSFTFG
jgi:cytochrome c-type biogenesis protein